MNQINPYYNPDKLNLDMLTFDEHDMCYEYNTLCFWATETGQVYSASDSGCSCPTPFEDYSGENQTEVIQKLERVSSPEHAAYIFDSCNDAINKDNRCGMDDKNNVIAWVKAKLKS